MSHSHMDFGLPCTLANGHILWEAELRGTLRYLSKLAVKEPSVYKEFIKKCIYPEYNLSKAALTTLENFKLIFESEHTVEAGIYSFVVAQAADEALDSVSAVQRKIKENQQARALP